MTCAYQIKQPAYQHSWQPAVFLASLNLIAYGPQSSYPSTIPLPTAQLNPNLLKSDNRRAYKEGIF